MNVSEATSEETPYGRRITSDGWFVLNLDEGVAVHNAEKGPTVYPLESVDGSPEFGVNVRVVQPGQPVALYHSENQQEGFLVLMGEAVLVVEEEERPLRQWDYFHCPAGVHHIIVGAGDGPCAILMIGARRPDEEFRYPVSEVAARYGASAGNETSQPDEAYADWPGEFVPTRVPWPPA